MHVQRFASSVCIFAPAKLNLFFEILGRRADGYHEIETLIAPVNWYDTLWFADAPESSEIRLECRWAWENKSQVALPRGSDNLVVKAIELLKRRAGVARGASVRLVKRIPAEAGLGGGSSDAAAALVAANLGWNLQWSTAQLAVVAAEIGSDVSFFLSAGAAVCRGRGERVEAVGPIAALDVVVVKPPEGLSTAAVYRACRPAGQPRCVEPLLAALCRGERRRLATLVSNRLEEAAAELSPWPGRLRREFERAGCVAHQMSGSGTSYFGICHDARHARRVAGQLRSRGLGTVQVARVGGVASVETAMLPES